MPYLKAGYHVIIVTLPEYDVRRFAPPDGIRGVLAAPPCTEFSFAKNMHGDKCKRDFEAGMEIVNACLQIIKKAEPKWWALENPRGYLRQFLGKPVMTFDPYDFGDPWKKKTDLWGKFNPPKMNPVQPLNVKFSLMHSKEIYPEMYGKMSRQDRRAITPPGFARAFFEANP
jgi:hypothetical protein